MRALFLVFGLLLGLVVAEAGLRLAIPQYDCLRFAKPDPEIGWVLKENYSDTCIDEGRLSITEIRVSSLNLRGPELEMPEPPGRFRVLFVGDSMTFGSGVSYTESLPGMFGGLAAGRDGLQNVEVVNAGVPGYGTAQELLFYERLAPVVEPDLVVLVFFTGNDLQDNACAVYNPTRPCFRLEDDRTSLVLALPDSEVIRSYGTAGEDKPPDKLHLVIFLWSRWASFIDRRPELARALGLADEPRTVSTLIESWYSPETFDSGWPVTIGILDRFAETVSSAGVRFVILVLPDFSQVSTEFAGQILAHDPGTPASARFVADPFLPQRLLTEWGDRAGIVVIDALAEIQSSSNVNDLYLADRHLSAAGNKLLAGLILSIFLDNGLLKLPH